MCTHMQKILNIHFNWEMVKYEGLSIEIWAIKN